MSIISTESGRQRNAGTRLHSPQQTRARAWEESDERVVLGDLTRFVENSDESIPRIAELIGVSDVILSVWIAGTAKPTTIKLLEIKRFLERYGPETGANDSSYIYPAVPQIRELHDAVVQEHRGAGCLGDLGNIVTVPKEATLHEGRDVFDTASAYARSIAEKRLFKDGNKRTALAAALVFLEINGVTDHDYYEPILQEALLYLSEGDKSEECFAQFFRDAFS